MELTSSSPPACISFVTWQEILDWAKKHYRYRCFRREDRIPSRSGLLYLVETGAVRMVGNAQVHTKAEGSEHTNLQSGATMEEAFLGFIVAGQPFEIIAQSPFSIQAYAHVEDTSVLWLYWNDLNDWPIFREEIFQAFRYQHQRKLLWLSILGQKHTINRLFGFLSLLIQEYGELTPKGYLLPYALTHAQIASSIGSTRVTITRLMGKLRQSGLITIQEDNLICLSNLQEKDTDSIWSNLEKDTEVRDDPE